MLHCHLIDDYTSFLPCRLIIHIVGSQTCLIFVPSIMPKHLGAWKFNVSDRVIGYQDGVFGILHGKFDIVVI